MQRTLTLAKSPSLSASLCYFLSAPAFLLAAAALLLWQGPAVLLSRWTPSTLALTHLMTLGYLGLTMTGAVLQLLPVVGSIALPGGRCTSSAIFGLLLAGALLLPLTFLFPTPYLFASALVLCSGFTVFLLTVARAVIRVPRSPAAATVRTMGLALVALVLAVVAGVALASAFAWPHRLNLALSLLVELHLVWALPGWIGLLILGVAFQVVPMFMVTPVYDPKLTRWLGLTIFFLLPTYTVALWNAWPSLMRWAGVQIAVGLLVFAIATLVLLARRTRPNADATTLFWRLSMASLVVCTVAWIAHAVLYVAVAPIALGIMFLFGFAGSAVNGMLYKIVPFLLWYHASEKIGMHHRSPSVKQLLPDTLGRAQFYAQLITLGLLMAAAFWPQQFTRPAGLALMVSSAWLEINLIGATHRYRKALRKIASIGVIA